LPSTYVIQDVTRQIRWGFSIAGLTYQISGQYPDPEKTPRCPRGCRPDDTIRGVAASGTDMEC
jgi:hypothetical protein